MFKNIKRNKLDFMLTDMQPVEISEYFSLRYFYEYLNTTNFMKDINKIMVKDKQENTKALFSGVWNSIPLKFDIYKRNKTMRNMSIPNPLANIMACQFVSLYDKEILNVLESNNIFSLRYHKNNNKLYYENASKRVVSYFSRIINQIQKRSIEQTGTYYSIYKYKSINDFTNSKKWYSLCLKYKKLLRIDYKDCFRSIYSHVYNWFKFPNINDAKNAKNNSSLYTTIDNIIQRTNSSATNGIIVGPEFSRMLAEIFLQNIDIKVYEELNKEGYKLNKDYFIGRYVDDIFVFADSEEFLNNVLIKYKRIAQDYMLSINENKICMENLPTQISDWFTAASFITRDISDMFYTDGEKEFDYYFKSKFFTSNDKQKLNGLLCNCKIDDRDTVVAYILSTIVNKLKPQKKKKIFSSDISKSKLLNLLDYVFYVYSFSVSFNNTQRLISIISYITNDINKKDIMCKVLKIIFKEYESLFNFNIYDIINLIPVLINFEVELPVEIEKKLENTILKSNDPILCANYLLYSRYNKLYYENTKKKIMEIIKIKVSYLQNKKENLFMYAECWWLFIFYNCPYVDFSIRKEILNLINDTMVMLKTDNPSDIAKSSILGFLKTSNDGFFCWNYNSNTLAEQITFRTYQKTIFRQNKNKYKLFDYASF